MISRLTVAVALGAGVVSAASGTFPAGVAGTGTMGVTNPPAATAPTALNQTSDARLLTLNSIDDFCFFAPPTLQNISDSETIEVAWCTKPRNNARLIPDGVLTGVRFLKTDFYVQIYAYGDFTKINIPAGDSGGELDPHGAFGSGNPIGGNVTTTVTPSGDELNVGEWMQFVSDTQMCIRACTNANSTYSAPNMCEHKLDEMGCMFVMPGDYNFNGTFASCDADVAYPPGWYPTATVDGQPQFSTFAQFFTGVFTSNGTPVSYTVGTTVTPTTVASIPSSSNCQTVSTIANHILSVSGDSTITESSTASGSGSTGGSSAQTTGAQSTGSAGSGSNPSNTSAAGRVVPGYFPQSGALIGLTLASVITVAAGAIMVL